MNIWFELLATSKYLNLKPHCYFCKIKDEIKRELENEIKNLRICS
jgi:hypothetical protein